MFVNLFLNYLLTFIGEDEDDGDDEDEKEKIVPVVVNNEKKKVPTASYEEILFQVNKCVHISII